MDKVLSVISDLGWQVKRASDGRVTLTTDALEARRRVRLLMRAFEDKGVIFHNPNTLGRPAIILTEYPATGDVELTLWVNDACFS